MEEDLLLVGHEPLVMPPAPSASLKCMEAAKEFSSHTFILVFWERIFSPNSICAGGEVYASLTYRKFLFGNRLRARLATWLLHREAHKFLLLMLIVHRPFKREQPFLCCLLGISRSANFCMHTVPAFSTLRKMSQDSSSTRGSFNLANISEVPVLWWPYLGLIAKGDWAPVSIWMGDVQRMNCRLDG